MVKDPDLSVRIGSLVLKNPIISASGTFGYGTEYKDFFDPSILGAIVLKGISLNPCEGNPSPRIYETPAGMLNSIGLQNVGVEKLIKEKIPLLDGINTVVIANIWGTEPGEYVEVARRLNEVDRIEAIEINISCPNVKKGGLQFGSDPDVASELTGAVREVTAKQLWVKLSPSVSDIGSIAKAVNDAGADVVSLINSIPAMAVDVIKRKSRLANIIGGLSGPAIHPVAVRMVYQAAKAVSIPVIGIGGIKSVEDALEFLIVGAKAVQIGTYGFVNPLIYKKIISDLERFCIEQDIDRISDIINTLDVSGDY